MVVIENSPYEAQNDPDGNVIPGERNGIASRSESNVPLAHDGPL